MGRGRAVGSALLVAGLAAHLAGCASGMRPVRQLETLDVMVGGSVNLPGAEFDPEFSAWVRFAPWTHLDLTVGGMATLPLFEPIAAGGLAEIRGHVPIDDNLRFTLDIAGELIRYALEPDDSIVAQRLTFMPLLVWEGEGKLHPYFGPKIMYLSHMDRVSSGLISGPGFRRDGAGVFMFGGTFGIETEVDVFRALGASFDLGVMVDAERGDLDGVFVTVAGYIGY